MTTKNKVENAIAALEAAGVDITSNYASWRDVGFALSSEFGEAGSAYFHRVSRMYPKYDYKACEEQFQRCLKSKGQGINIGSFFHLVKEAGVSIPNAGASEMRPPVENFPAGNPLPVSDIWELHRKDEAPDFDLETEEEELLPLMPDDLFPHLPVFLQKLVAPAGTPQERDMLLLGALASLSACFPNVHGFYDGKKVMPNLFVFITAKASSGKGILSLLKKVVIPIHGAKREEAKKLQEEAALEAENEGSKTVAKTPEKLLFLPANSSATGMFQLLNDNEGQGLIFETEGDTLSQVFKSDYGNYSDGFRKAFHHETISYYRRTEREYVDIEAPCLSAMLSGTPNQVASLIPSAENGLFSRFLFYYVDIKPVWKDVFAEDEGTNPWLYFGNRGKEFYDFWKGFPQEEMTFRMNYPQRASFNSFFQKIQQRYYGLFSDDYIATVRRLGLIGFRIAMLFSALRCMETNKYDLECSEEDFNSVLQIISVLVHHSSRIYRTLPEHQAKGPRKNDQEKLLDTLPESFSRPDYVTVAAGLKIHTRTADRYVRQFVKAGLLTKNKRNDYSRVKEGASK